MLHGSIQANPQQNDSTEQKINHYREKIKKYSKNKIMNIENEPTGALIDSQSNQIQQENYNRSKTSHTHTNQLPSIKTNQNSLIESGHKNISDKPSPRVRYASPNKHSTRNYHQLGYQFKNIGSRSRLNQSIIPQNN